MIRTLARDTRSTRFPYGGNGTTGWVPFPARGPQVSLTLSTHPPALGSLSQRQTAVPGRIASFTRGSGPHQGRQTVRGGRAVAGAALYVGALAASRANRGLRDFYQRLLAAGNPKQLVLTACRCNSLRS